MTDFPIYAENYCHYVLHQSTRKRLTSRTRPAFARLSRAPALPTTLCRRSNLYPCTVPKKRPLFLTMFGTRTCGTNSSKTHPLVLAVRQADKRKYSYRVCRTRSFPIAATQHFVHARVSRFELLGLASCQHTTTAMQHIDRSPTPTMHDLRTKTFQQGR